MDDYLILLVCNEFKNIFSHGIVNVKLLDSLRYKLLHYITQIIKCLLKINKMIATITCDVL